MKKIIITIALIAVFNTQAAFAEMLLFIENDCPFCTNVEKYLEENDLKTKLNITEYEISTSENKLIYDQKAISVGLSGHVVPLLIDGNTYKVGDTKIIEYLSNLPKERIETEGKRTLTDTEIENLKDIVSEQNGKTENTENISTKIEKEVDPILLPAAIIAAILGFSLHFYLRMKKFRNHNK